MEKVWLVKQESCVDGERLFNVELCASKETAKKVMALKVERLLNEGHFSTARPYMEGKADMDDCDFEWENDVEGQFHISDHWHDYYEDIEIEEKEIHP